MTVSKKEVKREVKRITSGKFCPYNPVYEKLSVKGFGGVFLENFDRKKGILHFFDAYYYLNPEPRFISDYDIYDLRLHPAAGILSIDYRFMKEKLGLKKPYEIKTINGLSIQEYNKSIENK